MARFQAVNKIGVCCVVFLTLAALAATPSAATVIRSLDGTGNEAAPADDPGWKNVGALGGAGAVYLGNTWVLTAAHLWNDNRTSVYFVGVPYSIVANSWIGLHDPDDPGTMADLGLLQIDISSTPLSLAGLPISQSAPVGAEVVGIGFGRDRAVAETSWDSDWNEVSPPGTFTGFKLEATHTKRWGKNRVDGTQPDVVGGLYTTDTLTMDFDRFGGAGADEMQAVLGDSGGGVFSKNNQGEWELAGIFILQDAFAGQPTLTAVYGNQSHAVDLSRYRQQIMNIVPEPSMLVMLLGAGAGYLLWSFWRRASRPTGC